MPICITEPDHASPKSDIANRKPPFWRRAVCLLILALPALWVVRLIFLYGVDVPYLEQWDLLCPFLEKMDAGTLRFSDFFSPPPSGFREQRVFFPRLILFGLAELTHWNVRAELLWNWLLDCLTAANLWRLASVTGMKPRRQGYWTLFLAYALLFSPMRMEIWVNGAEMQTPLTAACMTACLWIAPSVRFPFNWLFTMALSAICTFSMASGIVCWVLAYPLLWPSLRSLGVRWKSAWALFWMLFYGVCYLLWLRGFSNLSPDSDLLGFVKHPVKAIQFFLAYLGSAFALGTKMDYSPLAQGAGTVLVVVVVIAANYIWRYRRNTEFLSRTAPWFMLASFALANAAVATVARWDLGIVQALSSRYLGFSLMLPISLLFLVPTIFAHWRAHSTEARKATSLAIGLVSVSSALFLLHGLGVLTQPKRPELNSGAPCPPGREAWQVVHHDRLATRALLLLINVVDEPETLMQVTLLDEPLVLKADANFLNRIGYFRPRLLRSGTLREIMGRTARDPKQFGEIQRVERPAKGQLAIAGWAVLPDKRRQADAVVLTYNDSRGEPIMFALAMVQTPRTDLPSPSQQSAFLLRSGWVKQFDVSRLPPGNHLLRAWAFDAESCRAYPLHGNVNVVNDTNESPQLKK